MTRIARHPDLRYLGAGRYERIEPGHGEPDFRVLSDRGYETTPMTEYAARYWAARWTKHRAGLDPADHPHNGSAYRVQSRLVGVTDWVDAQPNPEMDAAIAAELEELDR